MLEKKIEEFAKKLMDLAEEMRKYAQSLEDPDTMSFFNTDYRAFIKSLNLQKRTENAILMSCEKDYNGKFLDFFKWYVDLRYKTIDMNLLRLPNIGRKSLLEIKDAIKNKTGKDIEYWIEQYKRIYKK